MEEDIQLLNRHASGDREAFNTLVLKYQKPLYSLLYRMVGNADDAADLAQKTFVKAFTGIDGFEHRSSFKTWLYQIAINLSKNVYRDRSRVQQVSIDEVVIARNPGTVESLIRSETRTLLRKAVADLPEKQRITVMLRIQEEKTFEEIADILSCSIGTAKANYHHGVQKLKNVMAKKETGAPTAVKE